MTAASDAIDASERLAEIEHITDPVDLPECGRVLVSSEETKSGRKKT